LAPGIFCHGFGFSAEEHFHVPQMMASHGYLMVSPTFMDGSAAFTKGKDGKEIWQDEGPLKGAKKNKDGS
jgi:hypothetical protein